MTANATHAGRITIPGTDVGVRGTLVAEPQTENMLLSLDDRLALGPVKVDTDAAGNLYAPGLVVPIIGSPAPVLWLLRFEPFDPNRAAPFTLGIFNLNASGVPLDDLVPTVTTTVSESDFDNVAELITDLGTFTSANDAVVAPLFNSGTATRTAADKTLGRGYSVKASPWNATGNGTTDDSAAIRSAIAAATAAGTYTYFPEGTYLVSQEGSTLGCLNLPSGARLTGPGKILMATGQSPGTRPIQIDGKTDVRIDGLTVDMNGEGGVGAHCIQTKNSSKIYISKVVCNTGLRGGISLMGSASHYRITECQIYSPIFNGITFYGTTAGGYPLAGDDIVIDKCHIEAGVQPIDSEPVGGFAKNVRITNNYLKTTDPDGNYAITMAAGAGDFHERWTVTGNTCIGAITAFSCKDSVIANNTIDATGLNAAIVPPYAIHGGFGSSNMKVTGNTIWGSPDLVGIGAFYASGARSGRPVDWVISNNEINIQGTSSTAAIGIYALSAGPTVIANNIIRGANASVGIWIRGNTAGQPFEAATVTGNDIDGFARGIYGQYFADNVKALTITGNSVRQTTTTPTLTGGIELSGTSAQLPQVSISGNTVDSVYGANAYKLSNVLVREGSSPATFSGTGSPEGVVTGLVGALYKRRDGSTGTSLYVKESGTGNTGWIAHGTSAPAQTTARLTTDQTVTNSTTAASPADLALAVAANSKYRLTAFIVYSATTTADVGLSWGLPASATLTWTSDSASTTASTINNSINRGILLTATTVQLGAIGAGTKIVATPSGTVTTGATAGTLQLKFAQFVAEASDAVIYADSWITLEKVS